MCVSVTTLVARGLIPAVQAWYQQNQHDTSKVFNSWISLKTLCSKVMALFIYLVIGAAIYEVLFVFYSYPSDDTETVTFDRPIHASLLLAITVVRVQRWWEDPIVSVHDWFKQVTHVSER